MTAPECIAKIILENGYRIIAEIGINACSFCDQFRVILNKKWFGKAEEYYPNKMPLDEYWLVDPWQYGYKCGSCGGPNVSNEKWDDLYFTACRRMVEDKCLRVLRMTSIQAAKIFPDGYFDLVYIDADHTYESVTQDNTVWLPKVREGGVICGHDYSGGWQPVVDAVDDFFIKRHYKKLGKEAASTEIKEVKKFYEIDGKHYRMDSGVWVVELK